MVGSVEGAARYKPTSPRYHCAPRARGRRSSTQRLFSGCATLRQWVRDAAPFGGANSVYKPNKIGRLRPGTDAAKGPGRRNPAANKEKNMAYGNDKKSTNASPTFAQMLQEALDQGDSFTAQRSGKNYQEITVVLPDGRRVWVKGEVEVKKAKVVEAKKPTVRKGNAVPPAIDVASVIREELAKALAGLTAGAPSNGHGTALQTESK